MNTPKIPPAMLRDIGLFGGLSDETLHELSSTLEVVDIPPGTTMFREGESGRDMFVLLGGEMEVLKQSKRQTLDARVALLGPGDWFGEMSILDVLPRSATMRALAPARLIRITAQDLDTLYRRDMKAYALMVLNIAREMSRRLRVSDGILADLVAAGMDEYGPPPRQM